MRVQRLHVRLLCRRVPDRRREGRSDGMLWLGMLREVAAPAWHVLECVGRRGTNVSRRLCLWRHVESMVNIIEPELEADR